MPASSSLDQRALTAPSHVECLPSAGSVNQVSPLPANAAGFAPSLALGATSSHALPDAYDRCDPRSGCALARDCMRHVANAPADPVAVLPRYVRTPDFSVDLTTWPDGSPRCRHYMPTE